MPITKKIHFIWAGGEKILPKKNMKRIKAWANKNPDFEVCLWIDKNTTSQENIDKYNDEYDFDKEPKISLFDITEMGVVDEFSRYHIDKLYPNYGASSDILRYNILSKYGGAYFDSDIIVTDNTNPLNYDGLFDSSDDEIIRITNFTQNNHVIGNDAFICTPGNPFMVDLYKAVVKNHYDAVTPYKFINPGIQSASWTVGNTGPQAVRDVCFSYDMLMPLQPGKKPGIGTEKHDGKWYYSRLRNDSSIALDRTCYQPEDSNDKNWLSAAPQKCTEEEAMELTLRCIEFEVTHMGILAINQHVSNMCKFLELEEQVQKEEMAEAIVKELKNRALDLEKCRLIELQSAYECVREYYTEFTPTLHDGDIALSLSNLKTSHRMLGKRGKILPELKGYFLHLKNGLKNSLIGDEQVIGSHFEKLVKAHLGKIILNYVEFNDIAQIKENLFNTVDLALTSEHQAWLKELSEALYNIATLIQSDDIDMVAIRALTDGFLIQFPNDSALLKDCLVIYSGSFEFGDADVDFPDEYIELLQDLISAISPIYSKSIDNLQTYIESLHHYYPNEEALLNHLQGNRVLI